jgi:hypothetical protein
MIGLSSGHREPPCATLEDVDWHESMMTVKGNAVAPTWNISHVTHMTQIARPGPLNHLPAGTGCSITARENARLGSAVALEYVSLTLDPAVLA